MKTNLLNPLNIIGLTYPEIEHLFTEITSIFKCVDNLQPITKQVGHEFDELEFIMGEHDFTHFDYGFTETTMWVKQIVNNVTHENIIVLIEL